MKTIWKILMTILKIVMWVILFSIGTLFGGPIGFFGVLIMFGMWWWVSFLMNTHRESVKREREDREEQKEIDDELRAAGLI